MYICPLKQTGFFVVSLRFPLVIPVELPTGREAGRQISVTSALPGTRSRVHTNRVLIFFVLGSDLSPSGWFLFGSASGFVYNEISELWECFLIEVERFAMHFPLWHFILISSYSIQVFVIYIMEVFHFSSIWPPRCIERKKIQVRPAISYVWVELKLDQQWRSTHCSVFSVPKNVI